MSRRWLVVLSAVLVVFGAHAGAGSSPPVPVRRPLLAPPVAVALPPLTPRLEAEPGDAPWGETTGPTWTSPLQRVERATFRLRAGPGAMASKGAGRLDFSSMRDVQNPALPAFGRPLDLAGLPAANAAFGGGDGLGDRLRLHVATRPAPGWSLRSALALDGSPDLGATWSRAGATGIDIAAAAAVGVDRAADGRVVVDTSLASRDRATGWNGVLSASFRSSSAGSPVRFYTRVGRRWQVDDAVAAALSLDGGLARHADADAASLGLAGKLSLADRAQLFLAYRCYGARSDARVGVAQHVVAGGRWRF